MIPDLEPSAPLIRLWTFGPLRIERLCEGGEVPRYESVVADERRGRRPLTLLKALLCQPQRFAPREVLLEMLWPEKAISKANPTLDDVAYGLRRLLRLPEQEEQDLVPRVHSDNGSGYQLARYPAIWLDADAFCWHVEQAARMERFGDTSLPFWEAAWQLARRGPFLADDLYSSWVSTRRTTLEGHTRQCVHRLGTLYREQGRSQEAEVLLRLFLESQPTDEDVLRPLLELLGEQERYQEAQGLFESVKRALARDGLSLDPRTQEVAAYLQTKEVVRHRNATSVSPALPTQRERMLLPQCVIVSETRILRAGLWREGNFLSSPKEEASPLSGSAHALLDGTHRAMSLEGIMEADIVTLVDHWLGHATDYQDLQDVLEHAITTYESVPFRHHEETKLSRRHMLIALLAALPTSLLTLREHMQVTASAEEFLPRCAASLTACRHLLNEGDRLLIEEVLPSYLPALSALAHHDGRYQKTAASLASQAYQLLSTVALHAFDLRKRAEYCEQAISYSNIADDQNVQVAALNRLGTTFFYSEQWTTAGRVFEEACATIESVVPLLRANVYTGLANSYAHCGREQDALRLLGLAQEHFPAHPKDDPSYRYASFDLPNMYLWEGSIHLGLNHLQQAQQAFDLIMGQNLREMTPERIRIEVTNQQARTALLLEDQEQCCAYLEAGIQGAEKLGNKARFREAVHVYHLARQAWPDEYRVKALADRFLQSPLFL